MTGFAAVVLTGGAARRLGGVDKPGVAVGGRPMRDRVLAAVADAAPRIVVGPDTTPVPAGALVVREEPAGGGPVAATAAGLTLLPPESTTVALLAGDLPLLTSTAVGELRRALAADATADGVCYVDTDGRRQQLCGVWRVPSLRAAVDRLADERGGSLAGASIRALLAGLMVSELWWSGTGAPPWFDCDTDDDVRRAEEWMR
ncbi:molybdenum cofactor guanylyltransferase [Micromonospora cathayae]|uniref:NTP transferase domain-containing protein n=1 Tax=Micromonospora cathayae TaxID=3028804 RepID=A0ABY7ZV95_9ACTN|nr:NTP transferase domain-containing protein [Micromonospora sp. HUAS 3]WDZ85958.1 NTP transferase domain-containing protein [Micromonospora sp. HUAS 3]